VDNFGREPAVDRRLLGMSEPADTELSARVHFLEGEVRRIRGRLAELTGDVGVAKLLASEADREVADLRAVLNGHTRVLNALRSDMTDLRTDMTDLRNHVDAGFAEMREGFAVVGVGMAQITAQLRNIEESG
jgi:chromosome segregation ATPase